MDRKNILVVGDRVPSPLHDGGSLRVYHILAALVELGHRVAFIAHYANSWPPFTERLREDSQFLSASGIHVVSGSSAENYLRREGHIPEIVVLYPEDLAGAYLALVRELSPATKVVFNSLDLAHVRLFREAKHTKNAPCLVRAMKSKRLEIQLAHDADCVWVVSAEEERKLRQACPGAKIHVVADYSEIASGLPPFSERKNLVFLASFPHRANVDAILGFAREVFPLIRERISGIRCCAIGALPPPEVHALAGDGFDVAGFVPDLAPYLKGARVAIAPLNYGAGIKIKFLTYTKYGLPTVTTTLGAEGLHVESGRSAVIADSPGAFAEGLVKLYTEVDLWNRIRTGAQEIVATYFSREALKRALSESIASLS